jgi:hypothetical protein
MLFIIQIILLILWFTVLPTLPWWIVFLPALLGAAWLCFGLAELIGVIVYDTRNNTHTPFFK